MITTSAATETACCNSLLAHLVHCAASGANQRSPESARVPRSRAAHRPLFWGEERLGVLVIYIMTNNANNNDINNDNDNNNNNNNVSEARECTGAHGRGRRTGPFFEMGVGVESEEAHTYRQASARARESLKECMYAVYAHRTRARARAHARTQASAPVREPAPSRASPRCARAPAHTRTYARGPHICASDTRTRYNTVVIA